MSGERMFLSPEALPWRRNTLDPILNRLAELYAAMDGQYAEAACHYGFQCDGCRENCCRTRFYHHTIIEYLYLMRGMDHLPPETREAVLTAAARVVDETHAADLSGKKSRFMCPLNREQRCLVYLFRPMICRLHGISHELHRNGGTILRGEGCRQFDDHARGRAYFSFDRTPLYRRMALLEKDARLATGITRKVKMTIAEMLTAEGLAARKSE